MTVKELIVELIGCDKDSNVVLEDGIEFTDDYGIKCSGSCYQIENIYKGGRHTALRFDNRHHFMKEEINCEEPKTGHWTEEIHEEDRWTRRRFVCSHCGSWQTYGETKYCPNCGAKMESEE